MVEGYAAFIRAVMVGREGLHREVLVDTFARAGAADVRSHLATGNVTFRSPPPRAEAIAARAAKAISDIVGRHTEVFVRSADDLGALLAAHPFASAPYRDARDRIVTFAHDPVTGLALPITSPRDDLCVFAVHGREIFTATRQVADRHPGAPGGTLERLLTRPLTSRAIGTVERVADHLGD